MARLVIYRLTAAQLGRRLVELGGDASIARNGDGFDVLRIGRYQRVSRPSQGVLLVLRGALEAWHGDERRGWYPAGSVVRVAGELRTADTCDVVALPEGDFEDGDGGPFGPDGGDVTRVAVRLFLRAGAEKSGVPPVLAWPALSTAGGGSCRVDRVSGGAKRALWRRDGRHLAELHFVHVKAAARIGSRTGVRAALQSFTGALADPFGGAWLWALGQLAGHADAIAGAAGTASAIRVLEVVDQAPATGGFGPVRRFGLELVVPAQSAD